jgi:hypothetical protein
MGFSIPIKVIQLLNSLATSFFYIDKYMQKPTKLKLTTNLN